MVPETRLDNGAVMAGFSEDQRLLSTKQVANIIPYSDWGYRQPLSAVRYLIRSGRLRASKPGKFWLIRQADLCRLLEETRYRPPDPADAVRKARRRGATF